MSLDCVFNARRLAIVVGVMGATLAAAHVWVFLFA